MSVVLTISCEGGNMGKKDIGLKAYLGDARRYADLWNGSVFQGKQMLKAEKLMEADTVLQKSDQTVILEKSRDLIMKQYRDGQKFAVFTVENQEVVDYGMPVRVMIQESMEYNKQIREIVRKNKNADKAFREGKADKVYLDVGEQFYKVRKEDSLHPVITLVVYWGDKEWTGAKSLHDMMNFGDGSDQMDAEIKKLVPEYPLHFLDLSKLEHPEYFRTELRDLFELYSRRNDGEEFRKYIEANEAGWDMDDESWYTLSILTDSPKLRALVDSKIKRKDAEEGKSMCKAIIDIENYAKAEGKAEGIIELLEEYGEVSEDLKGKIFAQKDLEILKKWNKLAAKVSGIQEFLEKI